MLYKYSLCVHVQVRNIYNLHGLGSCRGGSHNTFGHNQKPMLKQVNARAKSDVCKVALFENGEQMELWASLTTDLVAALYIV